MNINDIITFITGLVCGMGITHSIYTKYIFENEKNGKEISVKDYELKNCKFCRVQPHLYLDDYFWHVMECPECQRNEQAKTKEKAEELWNQKN